MDPELKPCPFCDSEVTLSKTMDESVYSHAIVPYYRISCDACEANMPWTENIGELIASWNSRWFDDLKKKLQVEANQEADQFEEDQFYRGLDRGRKKFAAELLAMFFDNKNTNQV